MCAQPRARPAIQRHRGDPCRRSTALHELRSWAAQNNDETLLPTGKNLRNLNPIVQERDGHRTLELAWWGYLINGAPAKFPSINTRSERLAERTGSLPTRAVVPATAWFEMQKPSRQWFQFDTRALELFAMAAVTQPGRAADGASFTCYSIIMRPATGALSAVHDRVPLLIPATSLTDWDERSATARGRRDRGCRVRAHTARRNSRGHREAALTRDIRQVARPGPLI
ncbi:SOS response-associated peptidase family protein [Microbacterium sp.]|uniref:SOS response-associated peptidase family protein n=1 Tax=Microbacterium sp. TaxID=51671 RepID=UPI003414B99E